MIKNKKPPVDASGLPNMKPATAATSDTCQNTQEPAETQSAIVAARYGLSPVVARLVCYLANIGGRLT